MFHFAEPEDAGLGVMILTPGLTRSSQVWMCFGLPLRTTITTTDWVRMPLVGVDFQSSMTCLLGCSRIEKPTRFTVSLLSDAELPPPHPARANAPTTVPATAAFHLR